MDIDRLRQKRGGRNVQQQNALLRHEILSAGRWTRDNYEGIPQLVREFLASQEFDVANSLVLHSDMSGYEAGNCHAGLVVTAERAFFEYDITLTWDGSCVEESECQRVDDRYPVTEHLPGKGRSYGYLCLDVLRELNGTNK